jgi:(p)ppGpp synthase/HD superfamily hydrolase
LALGGGGVGPVFGIEERVMTLIDLRSCLETKAFPSFADNLPLTSAAVVYARRLHARQRRISDGAPFILHPLEVAALLANHGAPDEVVAAGVLHDAIEDTSTTQERLRRRFGSRVAGLVASVSEDPVVESERERKAALRAQVEAAGGAAALIFAADKVAKVRELRTRLASADGFERPTREEADRKLEHYTASLAMLEHILPCHPLVEQLRFELEALFELPPGA